MPFFKEAISLLLLTPDNESRCKMGNIGNRVFGLSCWSSRFYTEMCQEVRSPAGVTILQ